MRLAALSFLFLLCLSPASQKSEKVAVPLHYATGKLCSEKDVNFSGRYRYKERIPYCNRHLPQSEKKEVAGYSSIPQISWGLYEFDHLIPLSAGGSNDFRNIWMEPIGQAHIKDRIEFEICQGLENGALTEKKAIKKLDNWFCDPCHDLTGKNICTKEQIIGLNHSECKAFKSRMMQIAK